MKLRRLLAVAAITASSLSISALPAAADPVCAGAGYSVLGGSTKDVGPFCVNTPWTWWINHRQGFWLGPVEGYVTVSIPAPV